MFFIGVIAISNNLYFDYKHLPSIKLENLGIFGDSFNVLTSLFTGLAFAGVIISVILQTQELSDARAEFKGQKEALIKQQKEMEFQSFDNKFFQMLNLLNNVIENLHIQLNSPFITISKNDFGRKMPERQENHYYKKDTLKYLRQRIESKLNNSSVDDFQNIFNDINNQYDTTFKYYFINLYQIINYIDINGNNKKEYTNIVRAQLSKDELILLFYNSIGVIEFVGDNYKKLVEKYAFFEHLRYEDLNKEVSSEIIDLLLCKYQKEAFGKNTSLIEELRKLKEKR